MAPNVDKTTSKLSSSNGRALTVGDTRRQGEVVDFGARRRVGEEFGNEIGGDDLAEASCGCERGGSVAGGDVEHALAGA